MDDIHLPRTTLTGYRAHIDRRPTPPATLTRTKFDKLDDAQRQAYDDDRLQWFGSNMRVKTPQFNQLVHSTRMLFRSADPCAVDTTGVVIDGPAGIGKTTSCLALAAMVEARAAADNPSYRDDGVVPVVFVEVPARATPKSTACQILDFFEYDYKYSATQDQLITQAVTQLRAHRTRLLIFDELQMLQLHGRSGDAAVNTLKTLMNKSGCLMVFAGIHLRRNLASQAAEQIMARCEIVDIAPYAAASDLARGHWAYLVNEFGTQMRLVDVKDDHLAAFADALLVASGGRIGRLRHILRQAMYQAFEQREERGGEFITADMFSGVDTVVVPAASPSQARRRGKAA